MSRLGFGCVLFACILVFAIATYEPTWESLDARPLPSWYDDVKFGIFVHWGVFSVPSYSCGYAAEWYWWYLDGDKIPCVVEFHNKTYGPDFTYPDFANQFKASTFFNATKWAELFDNAGAKYVVLTSKHHEGFTNWPSAQAWNWNSVDVGAHQDSVGLLTKAVKARGLHMGLYHSLFEWFNPLYLADRAANGTTSKYVDTVLLPQLYDIVMSYEPELIWTDGDWEMPDTYWKSKEFLAWLYNESPVSKTVVVNDRWGAGDICKHGGYWTCSDKYNPHKLIPHKWENAMTIDSQTWGYARNHDLSSYLSIDSLVGSLVSTVAYGGNLLLNVGPTAEGMITPIYEERLLQLGSWLKVNGDAIYGTKPWRVQNETHDDNTTVYFTSKGSTVYAIVMGPVPKENTIILQKPVALGQASVSAMGYGKLRFETGASGINVTLPDASHLQGHFWQWAFTLELVNFK